MKAHHDDIKVHQNSVGLFNLKTVQHNILVQNKLNNSRNQTCNYEFDDFIHNAHYNT